MARIGKYDDLVARCAAVEGGCGSRETISVCTNCGREFDPRESLMGEECQCQLCWEAECDRSWWEYMGQLDASLGPVRIS